MNGEREGYHIADKTPLFDAHVAAGGKMIDFAGWMMPVNYGSQIEEHTAVRTDAGMFDVSHMGQLLIEGNESLATELEKIIPIDLKKIKLNQSKYSFLTNEEGGIHDDLIVTKVEKGFNIILNAACKDNDFKIDTSVREFMFQRIGNGNYHQLRHWDRLTKKIVSI